MLKNASNQTWTFFVRSTALVGRTGESINTLNLFVSLDDAAPTQLAANTVTEIDSTNGPGWYRVALARAETAADKLVFSGYSNTANTTVMGEALYTVVAPHNRAVEGHN